MMESSTFADRCPRLSLPMAGYLWALALLAPIMSPRLPGNTTIVDYVNALFILMFWLGLAFRPRLVRWPLARPVFIIIVGSFIAMLGSDIVPQNLFTMLQDAYLYLWCVALVNALESDAHVQYAALAWVLVAAAWGAWTMFRDPHASFGTERLSSGFSNANMGADYYLNSLFLAFTPALARRRWLSCLLALSCAVATFGTLSAAAAAAMLAGGGCTVLFYLYMRRGPGLVTALVALSLVAAGLVLTAGVMVDAPWVASLPGYSTIVRYHQRTWSDDRGIIWKLAMQTYRAHPMGIGPDGFYGDASHIFAAEGRVDLDGTGIGPHDDYLTCLLERGPIGFAGLLGCIAALWLALAVSRKVAWASQDPARMLWTAALTGSFVSILTMGIGHQTTHFRFMWFTVILIIAQSHHGWRSAEEAQVPAWAATDEWPSPLVLGGLARPRPDDER